ncbi:hypothetical protein Tco_0007657 [Tanacetum coccineum]
MVVTVLSIFDREDLNAVYQLVMEKYQDEMPEGFDKVLWGDLMVMFNPDDENEFWNAQQDWKIVSWKLHGSSGVLALVTDTEESTMALELIKFVKKILAELESEEVLNSPCFSGKELASRDKQFMVMTKSNLLIADSLLKTIWFINAPCYYNEALASPKANELTIPEQTATGKGTSNPLMAGSLPKTTKPT